MDTMIRRRMMMPEAGGAPIPPTPPEPVEIEYLRTTGTQYIATLLTLTTDTTNITCEFQCKINNVENQSKLYAYSYPGGGLQVYTGQQKVLFNQGAYIYIDSNTIYTVITNSTESNRDITVNGTYSSQNFNRSVSNGDPIYIFGSPVTSIGSSYADFYYFKILRNDVLIFDGIPVRVGNIGYMFDRVSGQLFGNAGTGDFIIGNDKNS